MRDRRLRKTGGVFAGLRGGFSGAENKADAGVSFAAVERSMSDRLLSLLRLGRAVQLSSDAREEESSHRVTWTGDIVCCSRR